MKNETLHKYFGFWLFMIPETLFFWVMPTLYVGFKVKTIVIVAAIVIVVFYAGWIFAFREVKKK